MPAANMCARVFFYFDEMFESGLNAVAHYFDSIRFIVPDDRKINNFHTFPE